MRGIVIATVTQDGFLTVTDRVATMGADWGDRALDGAQNGFLTVFLAVFLTMR